MELKPGAAGNAADQRRDLIQSNAFRLVWVAPGVLIIFANAAFHAHWLSFAQTGWLMTICAAWFGAACYINGRRCGRTHCVIDGYLLPLLSVVGLLNLARVTHLTWQWYMDIFWVVIAMSFVPEFLGLKYLALRRR